MRYIDAITGILKGDLQDTYLVYGVQAELKRDIVLQLKHALITPGWESTTYLKTDGIDGLRQALELSRCSAFFGNRLFVVINIDAGQAFEMLIEYIRTPAPDVCLVVDLGEKVDNKYSSNRVLKEKGCLINCGNLRFKEVKQWLSAKTSVLGKRLEREAESAILQVSGTDLSVISRELEKAAAFVGTKTVITLQDMLAAGASFGRLNVFGLLNFIESDDAGNALRLLREIIQNGDHPLSILSLMYKHFSLIYEIKYMLKGGDSYDSIKSKMKNVNPFVLGKALEKAAITPENSIERLLLNLADADIAIKSGKLKPDAALELALSKYFTGC